MPVAGPAPRMLAYAIDALLLWCGLAIFFLAVALLAPGLMRSLFPAWRSAQFQREPELTLLPFAIVLMIVTYFGELLYFVFWESVSSGSSPGKRLVGLRVVRLDGLKLDLRASWIRNLMRAVDVLPSSYTVGLAAIVSSERGQRLGDLAAGTLVVRLDRPERALRISLPPGLSPLALSREQLRRLGDRERALVRGALRRAASTAAERRAAVLRGAASALAQTLELDPALAADPDLFLRQLWLAMQQGRR